MKRFTLLQSAFALLACLLILTVAIPATGDHSGFSDQGAAMVSFEQGPIDASAPAFVPERMVYENGTSLVAAIVHPYRKAAQSLCQLQGAIKGDKSLTAKWYGKTKARAPDIIFSEAGVRALLMYTELVQRQYRS